MKRPALVGIFLSAFALYLVTLHPAFPVDDSPETIAACVGLGIQHAPGYPLLTFLGKLATAVPVGGILFRVNLLAAVLGASACTLVAGWTARLLPGPGAAWAAVAAAASLGASRLFWECALSAKGGMYLLNLALVIGISALRAAPGASLLLGLALANHWMSAVWWVPGLIAAGGPWTRRRAGLAVLLILLGGSLYLQLPLCAGREPAWGDPVTPAGFLAVVLRRDFLPQAALKPAVLGFEQMGYGLLSPVRDGGFWFALLALAGMPLLWRSGNRGVASLALGSVLTLAAVSVLANPVHIPTGEPIFWLMDRFYLPWTAVFAAACGAGLLLLARHLPRPWHRAGWIGAVALPLGLLAANVSRNDHARDYLGFDYAQNLVAGLARPATILCEADYQCFPLIAYLDAEDRAPDVRLIITNPFLNRRWGWRRLARRLPEAADLAVSPASFADRVVTLADRLGTRGSLYHLSLCSYPPLRQRLRYQGILSRVVPTALMTRRDAEPDGTALFRRYRLRGMVGLDPYKDEAACSVLDIYCLALGRTGDLAAAAGRLPEAIDAWRRGLTLTGRLGHELLWASIGNAAGRLGRYAEAEDAFRHAVALKPHDLDLWTNLATACAAQGKSEEAFRWFSYVLERQPNNRTALANRAALLRQLGG